MQHINLIVTGILFVWRGTQGVGQHEPPPPPRLQQLALAEHGALSIAVDMRVAFSSDARWFDGLGGWLSNRPLNAPWLFRRLLP